MNNLCCKMKELIGSYHDEELDENMQIFVREHLANCEECYEKYKNLCKLSEIIKINALKVFESEQSITSKVVASLQEEEFCFQEEDEK